MVAFPEVKTKIILTLNGENKQGTLNIGGKTIELKDYTNAGIIATAINAGQTAYTSETNKPLISELTAIQTALNNRISSWKTGSTNSANTSSTIKAILDKLSFRANITTTPTTALYKMINFLKDIEGNITSANLQVTNTTATVKDEVDKAISLAKNAEPKAESTALFKAIKAYAESDKGAESAKTLSTAFTTFTTAAGTTAAAAAAAGTTAAAGTAGTATEEAVKKACQDFFATTDVIKYFEDTNLDILTVPKEYIATTTATTLIGGKSHKTRRSKAQKRRKTARRY